MPLTRTQKQVAQAIVNVFETSSVVGDYSRVTVIPGDTGHLSYGRLQVTLTSGNLHRLVAAYVGHGGAWYGEELQPYLELLEDPTDSQVEDLDGDLHLHNLLRAAADDPVMRDTQDELVDELFWATAVRIAARDGIETPLGVAVVYDSVVHGSWATLRRRVNEAGGTVAQVGERVWIRRYGEARYRWLAGHRRSDLRRTVYRMETFGELIARGMWFLAMPLVVRGVVIERSAFCALPPGAYEGPPLRSRTLELQLAGPLLRGLDVRRVQVALSGLGYPLEADGIYGPVTRSVVETFQAETGQPVTGTVWLPELEALRL